MRPTRRGRRHSWNEEPMGNAGPAFASRPFLAPDMEDDRETGAATERERVGRLVRRWRVNALVWIVESRGSDLGVNGRQSGIRWSI